MEERTVLGDCARIVFFPADDHCVCGRKGQNVLIEQRVRSKRPGGLCRIWRAKGTMFLVIRGGVIIGENIVGGFALVR